MQNVLPWIESRPIITFNVLCVAFFSSFLYKNETVSQTNDHRRVTIDVRDEEGDGEKTPE